MPCHLELVVGTSACELFDGMAVPVARREVHFRHAGAVAQGLVNPAHAFEEVGPVRGREEAHARDDVAHRRVVGDLLLVLDVNEVLGRHPFARDPLIEPLERGRDEGILLAQPLGECDREGLREGSLLQHFQHRRRLGFGSALHPEERVGDRVCPFPGDAPGGDPLGQAPEILDEHDAQRDGQSPQLTDRQGLDSLIGEDEAA